MERLQLEITRNGVLTVVDALAPREATKAQIAWYVDQHRAQIIRASQMAPGKCLLIIPEQGHA